jgi:hypothetical protein
MASDNTWWIYEPGRGWFWTARNAFPHIYDPQDGWSMYESRHDEP